MKSLTAFFLGSAFIFLGENTFAQTYPDTIQARKFQSLADKFSNELSIDSSTFYYQKAAHIYRYEAEKQKDTLMWREYLRCLSFISINFSQQYRFIESKNSLDSILTISLKIFGNDHQQTASIYHAYGIMYNWDIKYDESLGYLFKEAEIYKKNLAKYSRSLASNYFWIGRDYFDKGELETAIKFTNNCIEILKEELDKDKSELAQAYDQMASVCFSNSEYDKSLEYYSIALAIYKESYGEKDYSVGILYNNIGRIYLRLSDFDKSLEYFLKSLQIQTQWVSKPGVDFATLYINIGHVYLYQNDYDKALEYMLKSLKILIDNLGEKHVAVGDCFMRLGDIYYDKKNYTKALAYYQKSFEILSQMLGRKNPGVAPTYYCLARVYGKLADNYKAIQFYQKAIGCFLPTFNDTTSLYSIPKIENNCGIKDESGWNEILYFIRNKAIVLADTTQYLKANETLTSFGRQQITLQHFMACDQIIDIVRKKMSKQSDKMALGKEASFIYERAVGVCMNLAASAPLSEAVKYKQLAFYYSEKNKSAVLLEALAGQEAQKFAGIPDNLLQAEHKLQANIAFYNKQLADPDNLDSLKAEAYRKLLFGCNRSYDSLIVVFEKKYPRYHELKYSVNTASVKDIQRLIDKKTAMLSYFVGDSTITAYTVTKKSYNVARAKIPEDLEKTIELFRFSLTNAGSQSESGFKKYANKLYEMLFPNAIPRKIRNLIIIPDGVLATIPFEALLTSGTADSTPLRDLPYLVKKFSISYCSSATLFKETFAKKKGLPSEVRPLNDWIAYAPVFDDENSKGTSLASRALIKELHKINKDSTLTRGLMMGSGDVVPPLPGSESEVKNIFYEFDKQNLKTSVELKGNASERSIKSGELENYKYIHFATHGFVNSEKPELSGLLLAQVTDSTNEQNDGILYSGEIFNLKLNADLVVLSACETGLGKIKKGEGIIGLTRALLYAGAKNIMVSLWQVSDKSTSDLMISFYKNLLAEKSARLSNSVRFAPLLQQAKLKMISEAKFAHPFYWSPFILIGQ